MKRRTGAVTLAAAMLAGLLAGSSAWTPSPETAAAATTAAGGRVRLSSPVRLIDTRLGEPVLGPISVPGFSQITLGHSTEPGAAWLHACDAEPDGEPAAVFEPGEFVYFKAAVANSFAGTCLSASTPVHVVADRRGDILAAPTATDLQYVPLPVPRRVFERTIDERTSVAIPFEVGPVPGGAGGAVVLIEAIAPSRPGFAVVASYGNAAWYDLAFSNDRTTGIAYTELQPGSDVLYLRSMGDALVRVTLLGFLSTDGPDPTRLPPTLTFADDDVRAPGLRAVTPERVLDTRIGFGAPTTAKLAAGVPFELDLTPYVAWSSTAAVLNVTVTEPDGPGYLTVYPCDRARPTAANLNYVRGETVPNLVVAKLSVTGTVCIFSQASTHLVADLSGTFERDGGNGANAVTPFRLLDTREAIGVPTIAKVAAGERLTLQVAGRGGVPASGAAAVTMNVTVTEPDAPGYITAYPCDRDRPTAANLNYVAGQTVPNLVTVRLSAAGTVCLFALQPTHLVADLAAWYAVDEPVGYHELPPDRLLDTREPIGVPSVGPLGGGKVLTLQVAGRGGVPASGATGVTMNVTVTEPELGGFLTVFPCDQPQPVTANLNYEIGETVPNLVTVKLSAAGTACIFTQYRTHLVADVSGYFTAQPDTVLGPHLNG
jgi:hypothetical protein